MNPPLTEAELQALVGVSESLTLDFKRSEAIDKSKTAEISKDVSSFANSAGGMIVYGVEESGGAAIGLDGGIDAYSFSADWLNQVLSSNIQPKIDGLKIDTVPLPSKGANRIVFVITIPQAKSRGPHQAADKKYYKRSNARSVPMEDYEIRDVMRRGTTPDVDVFLDIHFESSSKSTIDLHTDQPRRFSILVNAINRSDKPALYYTVILWVDASIEFELNPRTSLTEIGNKGRDGHTYCLYRRNYGIPADKPLLRDLDYQLLSYEYFQIRREFLNLPIFKIGYEFNCPGFYGSRFFNMTHMNFQLQIQDPRTRK